MISADRCFRKNSSFISCHADRFDEAVRYKQLVKRLLVIVIVTVGAECQDVITGDRFLGSLGSKRFLTVVQ